MHRFTLTSARRKLTGAVALVAGLAVLTACSGGGMSGMSGMSSSGSPAAGAGTPAAGAAATGPHNAADVAFATEMIAHHSQAVEMATMASAKASDAEVKSLASAIAAAQEPEIKTMSGWLAGWNAPVPSPGQMQMDMGSAAMPGMMTSAEMSKLNAATGAQFDRLWVEMMTKHHEGAVEMARKQLTDGQNTEVKALANAIIKAQTAEIAQLKAMSKRLP